MICVSVLLLLEVMILPAFFLSDWPEALYTPTQTLKSVQQRRHVVSKWLTKTLVL
jgi:hypothetical protein